MLRRRTLLAAPAALALPYAARAQAKPLRIGFIVTLSTPAGYIGEDQRDAVRLAMMQEGGDKLGGIPVELVTEDDGLKPATAKQSSDRMLADGVRLFTGINWSNVLAAVAPGVLEKGGFYVSNNAGPSTFAGRGCHPNYFVVSFQNDTYHEAAGMAANELGYKRMVVMAPNYQAGRDAITGFKRAYKGEVLAEIYTKLEQTDFSVELARIRQARPDALYQFHPGGAGINLAKQYAAAGLNKEVPMLLAAFSMDERMISATGDAADGLYSASAWAPTLDNPANQAFVSAFRKQYNRTPTIYGAHAYDTARLIGAGLKASGGRVEGDGAAVFREGLRRAEFDSVRGSFKFDTNQHPIQDFYLIHIERDAQGGLQQRIQRKVATALRDSYAAECKMPTS